MDFLHSPRGLPSLPFDFMLSNHRIPLVNWDVFDSLFVPSNSSRQDRRRQQERDSHRNRQRSHHTHHRDRHGDRNADWNGIFSNTFLMNDMTRDIERAVEGLMLGINHDIGHAFHNVHFDENHRRADDHHTHRRHEERNEEQTRRPRCQRHHQLHKEQTRDLDKGKPVTCPICLDSVQTHGRTLPCDHTFHRKCIRQWQKVNNTCPTCRAPISD